MKNATKRLLAVLLCAVVITAVSACGKSADEGGGRTAPSATLTQAPEGTQPPDAGTPTTDAGEPDATQSPDVSAPETEPSGPYSVTMPDGTVVEMEHVPQRIVSMGPNITDMLFALGAGERVVGRTDYCDTPAGVENIPSVGTFFAPDVEMILALEPDLVIGSLLFSEEVGQQLSNLGIKVAVLYDSENMEGVYDMIRALGALTGKTAKGNALAEQTQKQIEETKAKYAGAEYADIAAPTVYYVSGYGEYGDYTAGGNTFIGQLITAAGGVNIAQDVEGWVIAHEVLIEADPQIILVGEGMAADFCATPGYTELSAVKEHRVVELDLYHLLERQSHRNAEIFAQLAELFHTPPAP